ncbi:MAG: EcsC family protein [Coriobacteriales bacterium]|jgi:hypothetical protein|nr:EcsC family protein [Coriobacteriales bacterium]
MEDKAITEIVKEERNHDCALDSKELRALDELTERYEKLIKPGLLAIAGKKVSDVIPSNIKQLGIDVSDAISEKQFFEEAMKVVASGFKVLEEQASKVTISEKHVVKKVNSIVNDYEIVALEQVFLARSYDIAKLANAERLHNLGIAFVEGAATGVPGFAGIPFNIVLSTFCYYRAVQSIAMFYGFDVKNDNSELIIAGEVFSNAMSQGHDGLGEISSVIGRVMVVAEADVVKQTVKKSWTAMAERGGIPLLLTQLRALANKAAEKALEKAGEKGLENVVFRSIFEQIGKLLSQKAISRAVPFVSAAIGALFDTAQMSKVLDFADTFYQKRFILEKEERLSLLTELPRIPANTFKVFDSKMNERPSFFPSNPIILKNGVAAIDAITLKMAEAKASEEGWDPITFPDAYNVAIPETFGELAEIEISPLEIKVTIDTGKMCWGNADGDIEARAGRFMDYAGKARYGVEFKEESPVCKVLGYDVTRQPMHFKSGKRAYLWAAEVPAEQLTSMSYPDLFELAQNITVKYDGRKAKKQLVTIPAVQIRFKRDMDEVEGAAAAIQKVFMALDETGARVKVTTTLVTGLHPELPKIFHFGESHPVVYWFTERKALGGDQGGIVSTAASTLKSMGSLIPSKKSSASGDASRTPFAVIATTSEAWLVPGTKVSFDE